MTIYRFLGLLAGVCSIAAYIPYVIYTVRGKIKPHPFSWLLWGILGGVSLVTYYAVGARDTLPLAVVSFVGPSLLFFLSIRYWSGGFSRFDYLCLLFSGVAILVYIIFRQAAVALTINLVGDLLAAFPTIRKTYRDPGSENMSTWLLFALSAVLSLVAIDRFTYGVVILPLYLALFEIGMCLLVLRGRLKKAS
jgi:hypothetical protein